MAVSFGKGDVFLPNLWSTRGALTGASRRLGHLSAIPADRGSGAHPLRGKMEKAGHPGKMSRLFVSTSVLLVLAVTTCAVRLISFVFSNSVVRFAVGFLAFAHSFVGSVG